MNVPHTPTTKSSQFLSTRTAIALLAVTTILVPAFFHTAVAAPHASTLVTLAKIREAWVQDLRTKQLEPILKFYAPDAVFLQPTGERITGSAALRTLFQTIMATFNSDLILHARTSKHPAIWRTTAATSRKPSPPAPRSPPKAAT